MGTCHWLKHLQYVICTELSSKIIMETLIVNTKYLPTYTNKKYTYIILANTHICHIYVFNSLSKMVQSNFTLS